MKIMLEFTTVALEWSGKLQIEVLLLHQLYGPLAAPWEFAM